MHMHLCPSSPHLDVEARLRAGLDEHHVELPRLGIPLLDGHLPAEMSLPSQAWAHLCSPLHTGHGSSAVPFTVQFPAKTQGGSTKPYTERGHAGPRQSMHDTCPTRFYYSSQIFLMHRPCRTACPPGRVLLPTRTTMTSLPRSVRTSSIHRAVFRKDCRSASAHRLMSPGLLNTPPCMLSTRSMVPVLHASYAPAQQATLACMTAAAPS